MKCLSEEQKNLCVENHNLIYYYIHKYNLCIDDYYDILAIGLCKSALSYNADRSKFSTYALAVMRNEHLQHERNKKSKKRNAQLISLSCPIADDLILSDCLVGSYDVYDDMCDINHYQLLDGERDKKILNLHIHGYKQREIGEKLGLSQGTINKRLKYIKKVLEENIIND